MRILHVVSAIAARYGGPSVAVKGMVSALTSLGHEVTVATTTADGPNELAVECGKPLPQWGGAIWYFPRTLPGEWHYSIGLARWLNEHVRSFDVVHGHGIFSYHTIPTGRATRAARVPYVIRPLGMLSEYSRAQRSWKKRPYYALLERKNLEPCAAIHVTSEAERDGVVALGYGAKTHVIPLGVEVPPASARDARELPLEIVLLARLHPGKGIELVFDAIESLMPSGRDPGVRLNVVGSGEPRYEAALRARVAGGALEGVVRFSGHLGGSEKSVALENGDVFVLASSHENFGLAVAEAMAAGLPVIISPQVALAADVTAAGAGLVVERNPGALASAISRMRDDPEQRRQMGFRARALALENFSWGSCGRRLTALYERVAATISE